MPVAPLLISPTDGDTLAGLSVLLDWNAVPLVLYYELQIDTTSLFNSGMLLSFNQNYINATNANSDTQKSLTGLLIGKRYYWRVRVNSSSFSNWSPTWAFVTPVLINVNALSGIELINIYPQPATNELFIDAAVNDARSIIVQIYDINGKILYNEEMPGQDILVVDVRKFKDGIYVLKIMLENQVYSRKILIE